MDQNTTSNNITIELADLQLEGLGIEDIDTDFAGATWGSLSTFGSASSFGSCAATASSGGTASTAS